MPVTRSTATSTPVTVYKLETGQFVAVPYPTTRPQNEGHPLTQNSNPPPLEDMPITLVRQGTPLPITGSASENLIETRKNWPIPPTPVPTPAFTIITEAPPQIAVIPHVTVRPKQAAEGCSWVPHCPICKNEKEHKEDLDSDMQREQPRMHPKTHTRPSHKALSAPSHKMFSNPNPRMHSTSSHRTMRTPSHLTFLIVMLSK